MEKLIYNLVIIFADDTNVSREIHDYGIRAILSTFLCLGIGIIVSFIFQSTYFILIFLIFLAPIKLSIQSYHCKTLIGCVFLFNLILLSFWYLFDNISFILINVPYINFILLLFLLLIGIGAKNIIFLKILLFYFILVCVCSMYCIVYLNTVLFFVFALELLLILSKAYAHYREEVF